MTVTEGMRECIEGLLGREPRGLEEIAIWTSAGEPAVIRVASLVDDKPFPTLFWLVDPVLNYRIDRAEAGGVIALLQARIDASTGLQQGMCDDHRAYISLRESFIDSGLAQQISALGFESALSSRGVGGIADFSRIRCLHTWYAAHLVVPNTVGRLLDEYWQNYPDA